MSVTLPSIDLTSATQGQQYKIDFTSFVKFNPGNMDNAHLNVFNESGCGLRGQMQQSGTSFFIPAGGWMILPISPTDAIAMVTVTYIITGAPVSTLITVYYDPSENIPPIQTLGNSPVGGSVATSGGGGVATSVANSGNTAGTVFVSGSPSGDAQNAVSITNDGIVSIGDAAHGGSLSVVGQSTFGGRVQGNGTNNLRLDTGGVGKSIEFDASGVQKAYVDSNGLNLNSGIFNQLGSNANPTWNNGLNVSGGLYIHTNTISGDANQQSLFLEGYAPNAGNQVQLRTQGNVRFGVTDNGAYLGSGTLAFLVGSISRINVFSGSVNNVGATFAHGLGVLPDVVLVLQNNVGLDSVANSFMWDKSASDATNVKMFNNAGSTARPFIGIAIKT